MKAFETEFRKHLELSDIHFITQALGTSEEEVSALFYLLVDPETVDSILDQPRLLEVILESPEALQLSPRLYFYMLTKKALRGSDFDSASLADYISGVLAEFSAKSHHRLGDDLAFYVVDWMQRIEAAPVGQRYQIFVHIGNNLLFLTSIFPAYFMKRKRRRGAPGLAFYEDFGRYSYQEAAQHPISSKIGIDDVYDQLAIHFKDLRLRLNDMSERFLFMESA